MHYDVAPKPDSGPSWGSALASSRSFWSIGDQSGIPADLQSLSKGRELPTRIGFDDQHATWSPATSPENGDFSRNSLVEFRLAAWPKWTGSNRRRPGGQLGWPAALRVRCEPTSSRPASNPANLAHALGWQGRKRVSHWEARRAPLPAGPTARRPGGQLGWPAA